ncbi:hypothetical protein SLEP1_g56416 [Rubroshorea leprosula]|uniref:Integrase catalytic domain-containing protein n=1 Tax=Rubroshorea leprosula TaxID=152421 RepID=A0AAV5MJL2_9ROSI|nr:hypothetical protein SLEP1_g56416 [Rubroshorea leprosula]
MECHPLVVEETMLSGLVWALFVDGATSVEGSGARSVLISPNGFKSEHALRFNFKTTNNATKYEVLIYGLKLASELKAQNIRVFSDSQLIVNQVNESYDIRDPQLGHYASVASNMKASFISFQIDKIPRVDNHRAYELSKLASSQDINLQRMTVVEILDAPSYIDLVDGFGIPRRIIADNGPQFRATTLKLFCDDYGIELSLMSVYTPQSNGQAESANKIILRGLKTRVLAAHSNWVDELNKVLWSCRTTPSSATGETPFSLVYETEVVLPMKVGLSTNKSARHDNLDNEQLLRENLDLLEEVREISRIKNMVYQGRVARFYNKRVRAHQF